MNEKKLDLRILKTKNNLYSTLEKLMREMPFEEIKVSTICNEALINRSTFYAHFNDKYELLEEFIKTLKDKLTLELNKNQNIKNTKEYYLELIRLLLEHLEEKKDTYQAIMINNKNSITMDIFYDVINKDIVKQLEGNHEFKAKHIPRDIIAKFYIGAVVNVCLEWLTFSNKYSKQDIIDYFNILIPDTF